MKDEPVSFGIDRLCARPEGLFGLRRIGLLTSDAATIASDPGLTSRVALQRARAPLVRVFSPEHGLRRTPPSGTAVPHTVDPLTNVPVYSVYGHRFSPPDELLTDLDLLLIDLPDVGVRWFTYVWAMTHALDACARTGTPVAVLDRPNPLGGDFRLCEGPELDETCCASFLGRMRMPVRHSLTMGELARVWQAERAPRAQLAVLRCSGWSRGMLWPATQVPFVPASSALPSFESALLYPGLGLFEGTNMDISRGGPRPYQLIAAGWLDPAAVRAHRLMNAVADGLTLEPTRLRPPLGGELPALQIRVEQPELVRPVALGLALLITIRELHASDFRWTDYPTVANPSGTGHFERLVGRLDIRPAIEGPWSISASRLLQWCDVGDWLQRVQPYLLYE
jgi:uncharacterized protein YbbC (DUF1343 family)